MRRAKKITLKQALSLIKSGDQIVTGLGASEAQQMMKHLHLIADKVKDVTITNCLPLSNASLVQDEYKNSFRVDGWFFSPFLRKHFSQGNINFIPNHLHLAAIRRLDYIQTDVYVGSASMPDKHGYISLSLSNTYEKQMIQNAKISILEINPNYPRTFGDVMIHQSEVDYLIECDYPVPELPNATSNEKDMKIGKIISELIHDGDTIQLGIGGIPNAVASALTSKKDLGIHTEMFTTGMMDLMKAGVINNRKKNLHPNQAVCTFALGTRELYDFLDDNPGIAFYDGNYVNDPYIIGKNDNMVSINTAIEVDLSGQVASESLGAHQFSGTGGQVDTATGALRSKNGRSIIALYSTAYLKKEDREVSKIVPVLKPGSIVTLSRNDVDIVVTEYGAAHLRGKNVKQRVESLVSIAHPKYRDEIYRQAIDIGMIAGNK